MGRILYTLFLLNVILVGLLAPATTVHAAPPSPYAVVQTPRLNVRAAPSTQAPVVGQVTEGERITVLGRNGEGTWLRIESAGGLSGWVYTELTQLSVPITAIDVYASNEVVRAAPTQAPSAATSEQARPIGQSNTELVVNRQDTPRSAAPAPAAQGNPAPAPNPDPRPIGPGSSIPNPDETRQEEPVAVGDKLQPLCQPNQLRTVSLGGQPRMITALDDRLYVALANIGSLLVVDANMDMMLGTSRTSASRIGSVTAGDDYLYVVDEEKERLVITSRYGASRGVIDLPARPGPVAVTDGRAFVLHPQMGAVSIVDLNSKTTIATLSIGADPRQIVVISGRAFIGHAAGFLSVVDGLGRRQEQLHLPVNDVVGMTANPKSGMIYIASGADRRVVAVDTNTWTLANTWDLELMPSSLAYNDITDHLFVLDRTSQFVTVLSGADPKRVSVVRVSDQPGRDEGRGLVLLQSKLYVMHPGADHLSVWLDRTCTGELAATSKPSTVAHTRTDLAPRQVEARIGVVWPHGGSSPDQASYANVTATL
ncbi:MAG: SH3 domain-containing protein, partial [Caldilineae bacterium]